MSAAALRVGRWHVSGTLEALKWVALVAMVADHVNTVLLGRSVGWLYDVGRIAMPLFCLVLGENIARAGADLDALRRRLLAVGVVCIPLTAWTINGGNVLPLNVMLTFALAVAVWRDQVAGGLVWTALAVPLALFVDYQWSGVALVVAAAWWARAGGTAAALAVGAALLAICLYNGNGWALVGAGLFFASYGQRWQVPRVRWLFWWFYPVHLAVLAGLEEVLK